INTLYSSVSTGNNTEDIKAQFASSQQAKNRFSSSSIAQFLSGTNSAFDMAFLNASYQDKTGYEHYLDLLPFAAENSVLIIDNIYQNETSEKAWNTIKHHKDARVTVDLFYLGLVFFRTAQV